MRKLISLLTIGLLALTGCGASPVELDETEEVTLTVMGWGFGEEGTEEAETNINRLVIDSYEELHPNVTIEVINPAAGEDYNATVMNMAASSDLPDVFLYAGHQDPVVNQWAMDVSDYVKGNETYDSIHESIKEAGKVGDSIYGLPVSMHFGGIKVNTTLFEKLNLEPLTWGFSMEDYMTAIEALSTDTTKGTNISGNISDWYPATQDSSIEWFNFNGSEYDYENEAFLQALAYDQQIFNDKLNEQSAEEGFFPEGSWPIGDGYVGTVYDFTWWDMKDVPSGDNWEFIGLPGGDVTVVPDYMYVSSTTEYPEWATDFAIYYGAGSYEQRYNDAKEHDLTIPLPLTSSTSDRELYDAAYADSEGMLNAMKAVVDEDKGIVEAFKVTPGYPNSRFNADTGIINDETGETYNIGDLYTATLKGELEYADYADQLSELSNSEYQKALTQLGLQ